MQRALHIRPAAEKDTPILSELIRRSFRDVADKFGLTPVNAARHPSNCEDSWVEDDMRKGITYYLLECDSQTVGCVALERSTPDVCFLNRLAVLPAWRGKGFGKMLVRHAFDEAQKLAFSRVHIAIIAEHDELKRWYLRLGFVAQETKAFPHLPFKVTYLSADLGRKT